ncbi:PucR family transcriptional regulator [Georgenia thermotolerans]|uniref:PucR family transcriptional regulator n=1 Tax=Georgenia thermotolerans TaxID=527326 RepID=A0A7J5USP5_9MICO|nr:PucR family transcriptional regulator [Georgenia thermotolerans]KAE8765271.1 PucR family transcriptional regulator [Georgenia thermotolerans]
MPVSVGQVLATPAVQAGHPEVLCAADRVDRTVRWVHVFEGPDPTGLLSGGELLLTTLIALPDDPGEQRGYVRALVDAGAVALVIELGRRFAKVPDVMVAEAADAELPVIALHKVVKFVTITEAVHAQIVDEQHDLLTFARQVHEAFTAFGVEGADAQTIVDRTAAMAGAAVVLEDLGHEAVAHALAGASASEVLRDWSARSRLAAEGAGTRAAPEQGWLVTDVGPRQGVWGRLVLVGSPAVPEPAAQMLLERAAQALAVARLLERDVASVRARAHARLLGELLHARGGVEEDLRAAAGALGLAPASRYLAVCLAPVGPAAERDGSAHGSGILAAPQRDQELAETVVAAAATARLSALVAPIEDGVVGALVALTGKLTETTTLDRLARALDGTPVRHVRATVRERDGLVRAGADLAEAAYVARAAALMPERQRPAYYRITDIGIRGLLMLLGDDARVTAFAERELQALLVHDAKHGEGLVDVLRQYLEAGGNIAALARASHLSRQALYARLRSIERVLGADLADAETRTGLHVALLAKDVAAR